MSSIPEVWLRIFSAIAGLLVVTFLAWAGVVYAMGTKALEELQAIRVEIAIQSAHVQANTEHRALPWHGLAGNEIAALREKMRQIERDSE